MKLAEQVLDGVDLFLFGGHANIVSALAYVVNLYRKISEISFPQAYPQGGWGEQMFGTPAAGA